MQFPATGDADLAVRVDEAKHRQGPEAVLRCEIVLPGKRRAVDRVEEVKRDRGNSLVTQLQGHLHHVLFCLACNGDDTKGWIAKALLVGGVEKTVAPLQRAIATKVATGLDAPVALAVSPDGNLVVGQMGEIKVAGDSGLTFYHPASGKRLAHFATGLHDISGLAYGPGGMLYATDFSWLKPDQGSLSQLLSVRERKQTVRARLVLPLERPTAITFDQSGAALVTVIGSGEKPDSGKLLRIELDP